MEHTQQIHPDHDNLVMSTMLLILGWIFKELSALQVGEIMTYILQFLSIISVSMIIVINWDKFSVRIGQIFKRK